MIVLRLAVLGGIVSLGAVFSYHHLIFDLLSHFRVQYVFLLLIGLGVALWCRALAIGLFLSACLLVHVYELYSSQQVTRTVSGATTTALIVMSSNLLASNADYASHIAHIKNVNPDVIVFQEYTSEWDGVFSDSLTGYPYRILESMNSPFGIALYSKYPVIEGKVVKLNDGNRPSIDATVLKESTRLRVFGTHPPPPVSTELYNERNRHLEAISALAAENTGPMIVVGDLNISPWSAHFRNFLSNGNLSDFRAGHGILPTWPAGFAPLLIPIDHIVGGGPVRVVSIKTSRGLGSDHRTLWMELNYGL